MPRKVKKLAHTGLVHSLAEGGLHAEPPALTAVPGPPALLLSDFDLAPLRL